MTRITNALRDAVVKNALKKAGIPEMKAAHHKKKQAWLEECRIFCLGGQKEAERLDAIYAQYLELAKQVPDGVLSVYRNPPTNKETHMKLNVSGASVRVTFDGESRICPLRPAIPTGHPLAQRFLDLEGDERDIEEKAETIKATVRGALEAVSTVKKLLEVWPEAVELIPRDAGGNKSASAMPMIRAADLNALIGLPSDASDKTA